MHPGLWTHPTFVFPRKIDVQNCVLCVMLWFTNIRESYIIYYLVALLSHIAFTNGLSELDTFFIYVHLQKPLSNNRFN